MTEFEKAVEALMGELTREIGSGLLTFRALELMPEVEKGLQKIKRLERDLALIVKQHQSSSPPPPENGLSEKGKENS